MNRAVGWIKALVQKTTQHETIAGVYFADGLVFDARFNNCRSVYQSNKARDAMLSWYKKFSLAASRGLILLKWETVVLNSVVWSQQIFHWNPATKIYGINLSDRFFAWAYFPFSLYKTCASRWKISEIPEIRSHENYILLLSPMQPLRSGLWIYCHTIGDKNKTYTVYSANAPNCCMDNC